MTPSDHTSSADHASGTHPRNTTVAATSAMLTGISGHLVGIPAVAWAGRPSLTVTGPDSQDLPETRDRIRAAIINGGLQWPTCGLHVRISPPAGRRVQSVTDLAASAVVLAIAGGRLPPAPRRPTCARP